MQLIGAATKVACNLKAVSPRPGLCGPEADGPAYHTYLSRSPACMVAESCDLSLQNVKNASCSSMVPLRARSKIEGAMYVEAGIQMCLLVPVAI